MTDPIKEDEVKMLCEAFFMFDTDNSGSITKDEIENVFEKLGAPNVDAESKF